MNNEDLEKITNSIQEKIGVDASALIADDLGNLITRNTQIFDSLNKKDNEIKQLKSDKEKLVIANGNLLQQIPMASDYDKHQSKEEAKEEKKSFNLKDAFDKKGNFKR